METILKAMQTISKRQQHWPVLKVKTTVRAGYYLGLTLSAGAGASASNPETCS